MDDLFLSNQVTGLLNQPKEPVNILRPLVQNLVGVLGLRKRNNSRWTINLGIDRLGHNQLGQELLAILVWQVQQLCQTLRRNACVVFGNHTNVLLG